VNNEGAFGAAMYYKCVIATKTLSPPPPSPLPSLLVLLLDGFVRRIPFQHALQMIANRSVYLDRGFAFVPLQRLVNIIVTRFRIHLSKVPCYPPCIVSTCPW
jgi:hypothetical protein